MIPRSYQVSFAEYSSEQLDESTHKTASFTKIQHLFSPKKDRKEAMKVTPFPVSTQSPMLLVRKPTKVRLGSTLFSKTAERVNVGLVFLFALVLTVNYSFDADLFEFSSSTNTLVLSIVLAFAFQDCAKFAIFGCVSATQKCLRSYQRAADAVVTVACLIATAVTLRAADSEWDCRYYQSASRLLSVVLVWRRAKVVKVTPAGGHKAGNSAVFSIELAGDKVQQVLKKVTEMPWVEYSANLKEELLWCLDVIVANKLSQTIVNVGEAEQGLKKGELLDIVNQYSKAGEPPSVLLPRKSGVTTPINKQSLLAGSEMTEEVKLCFRGVDTCEFDVFRLKNATKGNELFALMHLLFLRKELLTSLSLDVRRFTNYTSRLQSGYNATVLYHNATHAADVTQTIHYFLGACDAEDLLGLTSLEIAACYLAAAGHDFEHPGLTNSFLVNTQAELAIRYNDKSVLENHHISATFALAIEEDCDIYADLESAQYSKMRNLMIGMVLGTDAVNHFSMLSRFKTNVEAGVWMLPENVNQTLELLLHSADISNPAKPWPLCQQWADLVLNEFWLQGDKERKLGLPLSFLADRFSVNVSKSQVGFIDVIVAPLYDVLCRCFKSVETNVVYLAENREKWAKYDQHSSSPVLSH